MGVAACFVCQRVFTFDIDTVLTVWIDPLTGAPPDAVPFDAASQDAVDAAVARSVQRPICPECTVKLNAERAKLGLPPAG